MLKEIIVKEIPKFNKKLKNTENIVHHQITSVSEDIYSSPQQELNILKQFWKSQLPILTMMEEWATNRINRKKTT